MDGVDGRLDLVGAWPIALKTLPHDGLTLADQREIPHAAILVAQQHEVAVGVDTGGAPRLDEQHQRQQSHHFRLLRHQLCQEPPEADRLGAEVLPNEPVARRGCVPLVENQVDDGQHSPEAARELGFVRDAIRDSRVANLCLGPDQPLGHRRFRRQKRAGDLGRREPPDEPQRQGDLDAGGQRRVAAREDQAQPIVAHGVLLDRLAAGMQEDRLRVPILARRLATDAVDRLVAGSGDDPTCRARRQSAGRPRAHRRGKRILHGVLGHVDVADDTHQDRHGATILGTEHPFDLSGRD